MASSLSGASMDPVNIIQLVFAGTTAIVLGRLGFALARYFERRLSGGQAPTPEAESRLRTVEDECALLRQEMSELQERQDFTERVLHQGRGRLSPPDSAEKRVVTPH
jgi:hypothetical protein